MMTIERSFVDASVNLRVLVFIIILPNNSSLSACKSLIYQALIGKGLINDTYAMII
jgi:hypothetical protein